MMTTATIMLDWPVAIRLFRACGQSNLPAESRERPRQRGTTGWGRGQTRLQQLGLDRGTEPLGYSFCQVQAQSRLIEQCVTPSLLARLQQFAESLVQQR